MDSNLMKNIVVLKNLPSNIIDEAIIILKDNGKKKIYLENTKQEKNKSKNCFEEKNKDYILKEAEMIISNYISDIKEEKKMKSTNIKALEKQCERLKKLLIITGTLTFLTIILIFM